MKKTFLLLLCVALLLSLFSACAKKTSLTDELPGTIWDNHGHGMSLVFEEGGICTVSNSISMEICQYTAKDDTITIKGAISEWDCLMDQNGIAVGGILGFFEKSSERSYYPKTETYNYIVIDDIDEDPMVFDLSFWNGVYNSDKGTLTIGSANIPNVLTFMLNLSDGHITGGTIKPNEVDRFVLENASVRITLSQTGAVLESLDDDHKVYEGTYTKRKINPIS